MHTSKATTPNLAQKPRIFVEDTDTAIAKAIEAAGYSVFRGNLGYAARVSRSGKWIPLEVAAKVPDAKEQEILFLSLKSTLRAASSIVSDAENGAIATWQSCQKGLLDTRPIAAYAYRHAFEEVLKSGGIFIIELARKESVLYRRAKVSFRTPEGGEEFRGSSWNMLPVLDEVRVEDDSGQEIRFESEGMGRVLAPGAMDARYQCVLAGLPRNWTPLAHNKRGKVVSAAYRPPNGQGLVLLLPTMPHLPSIIERLFKEVFPEVSPSLFPEYKAQSWVHDERYESPGVVSLRAKRRELDAEYNAAAQANKAKIEAERASYEHYHTLLRGTGDELVAAVIRTLNELGFQNVKDVDNEGGPASNLVEDIQILDRKTKLVVDVKGVNGKPSDAESQQAEKHARMRMREWPDTDVQPLTIINSQRLIPPHERDEAAYRPEMIKNAEDFQAGLMTTWDLFRIARAVQEFSWPKSAAQDILYQTGRIKRIPSHYTEVGRITKTFTNALLAALSGQINRGDRYGVVTPEGYFEAIADSIQLNNEGVEIGRSGQDVGIALSGASSKLKEGWILYRVEPATETQ